MITTGEGSGLENLPITGVLTVVWAVVGILVALPFSWPLGWTQTEINVCDGLLLFIHLVGSNIVVQIFTGGWSGTEVLDPTQQPLVPH